MRAYFYELGAALSQLLNAILSGNRDQTFSARSYEAAEVTRHYRWFWVPVLKAIDLVFGAGHCEDAYRADTERTYS